MSKTLKTVVTGAALATSLLAANAKADELVSTEATAQPQVAEASQQMTPASVKTAQEALEQADSVVKTQQTVVDKATEAYTTANQAHTDAQGDLTSAQELASQSTPENIATAEAAIPVTESAVTSAEADLADANAQVEIAETAVDTQAQEVAKADAKVADAETAVSSAQSTVDDAQALVDNTGAKEIIAKADATKTVVDQATDAVATAEKNLETAKTADAKLAESISKQEATVATAKTDADTASKALESAKTDESNAKAKLDQATTALKTAEDAMKNVPVFTVSNDYVDALNRRNEASIFNPEMRTQATNDLKAVNQKNLDANTYTASDSDKARTFDPTNVPEDIQVELSLFGNAILSQIRQAFGLEPLEVNERMLTFAYDVAAQYTATKRKASEGHYDEAVQDAAEANGLKPYRELDGQLYENLFVDSESYTNTQGQMTVADAKELIYHSFEVLMFNGYEWMHANSLSGSTVIGDEGNYKYAAIAISTNYARVHVMQAREDQIINKDMGTVYADPYDSATASTRLAQAKTAVTSAQASLTEASNKLASAQQTADAKTQALKTAQDELANLKATGQQTPAAQTAYTQALNTLDRAVQENNEAQKAVELLNADAKTKQEALTQAKAILAEKQALLDQAKTEQANEVNILNDLKAELTSKEALVAEKAQALENAKVALQDAKAYLEDLKEAPEKVKEAEAKLKEALQQLTDAKATLDRESALLETLQAERDAKQLIYDDLKAKQAIALDQERQAIEARGQEAKPVTDAAGKIIGYRAVDKAVSDLKAQITERYHFHITKAVTQKIAKSTTYKAKLPETGETETATMSLLGLGLLGLAAVGVKRRRN